MTRKHNSEAVEYIQKQAESRKAKATDTIAQVFHMSNIQEVDLLECLDLIQRKSRIGIHFHPYRLTESNQDVLALLTESGAYKSAFETQISNGSATAYVEGRRDQWENLLFDNVFSRNKDIPFSERPKYGALDLLGHSNGPCPRFGSCCFLLKPDITNFATLTYGDSYTNPDSKGTLAGFDSILASMVEECFERDYCLGETNLRPHTLLQKMRRVLETDYASRTDANNPPSRNLDHYIEAQIHTAIDLQKDVEVLVVDYSYKGTEYEARFEDLCALYEIKLKWNRGLQMSPEDVPDHFRGPAMPALAQKVAIDNKVTAYALGQAEKQMRATADPQQLQSSLQELKYLWHTLVKYGLPIQSSDW